MEERCHGNLEAPAPGVAPSIKALKALGVIVDETKTDRRCGNVLQCVCASLKKMLAESVVGTRLPERDSSVKFVHILTLGSAPEEH